MISNPGQPLTSHPELQALSDDALAKAMDDFLVGAAGRWSIGQLMAELNRRSTEQQNRTVTRLTWSIAAMTAVSTAFVVLSALHVVG